MYSKETAALVLLGALLSPAVVAAAETLAGEVEQDQQSIEEIIVSGQQLSSRGATIIIEREFVIDVAEALSRLPGANRNQNGRLSGIAQYRGMFGDRVSVSIDGLGVISGGPNSNRGYGFQEVGPHRQLPYLFPESADAPSAGATGAVSALAGAGGSAATVKSVRKSAGNQNNRLMCMRRSGVVMASSQVMESRDCLKVVPPACRGVVRRQAGGVAVKGAGAGAPDRSERATCNNRTSRLSTHT